MEWLAENTKMIDISIDMRDMARNRPESMQS